MRETKLQWVGKRAKLESTYSFESSSSERDVSDDGMSEDGEGSGVESEQELDREGDHGYNGDGRREGVRSVERKAGVWIVVVDYFMGKGDKGWTTGNGSGRWSEGMG